MLVQLDQNRMPTKGKEKNKTLHKVWTLCLKVKGKDWAGGFVRVGLVLFALFLTASLGILMMERKCSIQIYSLKCGLISEKQSARYIVGVNFI